MDHLSANQNTIYPDGTSAFLLRILADHLAQRPTQPPEDVDWEALFRLAQMHQVSGIVYAQCKHDIPKDKQAAFKSKYSATLFYYANRVRDMSEVGAAFSAAGIPYCAVKGLEVARYYPAPALRTMGDCDIVVSPDDTARAIEAMRRLGFQDEEEVHAWTCEKDGRMYELHNVLVNSGEFAPEVQKAFFNGFMPYVHDNELDWNFHFLFLIMHLRKHFLNGGVGLRQFFDLAVLIVRGPELDWDWIERKAKELYLEKFLYVCCFLLAAWFDARAPIAYEPLDGEMARTITRMVIKNGVFGYSNEENQENHRKSALIHADGPKWIKRMKMLVESTFPAYSVMRNYSGCAYVDGRPYLLPIAWLQRFGILLTRRDKAATSRVIRGIFTPTHVLDDRQELLNRIGIELEQFAK